MKGFGVMKIYQHIITMEGEGVSFAGMLVDFEDGEFSETVFVVKKGTPPYPYHQHYILDSKNMLDDEPKQEYIKRVTEHVRSVYIVDVLPFLR
jgi:hypothetical protein